MRVLRRRGRTILCPVRDTFERIHHSAHEDRAEEVLERTEEVGVEEQREKADDDEEDDDRKVDKFRGELEQTVIQQDESQSSHDTRLC